MVTPTQQAKLSGEALDALGADSEAFLLRPEPGTVALRRQIVTPSLQQDLLTDNEDELSPVEQEKATVHSRSDTLETGVTFLRWSSIAFSALLLSLRFDEVSDFTWLTASAVFFYACYRTLRPIPQRLAELSPRHIANAGIEVGLHLLAVTATGLWSSPLLYPLSVSIVVVGLAHGRLIAGIGGSIGITVITALSINQSGYSQDLGEVSVTGAAVVLLAALVAGYGYQLTTASRVRQSDSFGLNQLNDANRLLLDLHRVAQTLPGSLDRQEVMQTSISRLRNLMKFDSAAIFTIDTQSGSWLTVHQQGMALDNVMSAADVPPLAAVAARDQQLARASAIGEDSSRFVPDSQSSMYTPLVARNELIGLLAIEALQQDAFSAQDAETLKGFAEPVGLAIDNARWFERIKSVSADEERSRIARDLHDRLGQSLAHLGFELDRLIRNDANRQPLTDDLANLRKDVRSVVGEVRETLYDLRTDVGDQKDLTATVEQFASRVAKRNNLSIALYSQTGDRLPILQEREMWRIAQEALINVERHADATEVNIFWSCTETDAFLEVADNGCGLSPEHTDRTDSYGILGMRERANSVGASLDIISRPNQGTNVRCYLTRK